MEQKNVVLEEKEIQENLQIEKKEKSISKKDNISALILIFIATLIILSINWLGKNTGNLTLEQIIFHLKVPVKGTNFDMVWDYIYWTLPRVFAISLIIAIIMFAFERIVKINKKSQKKFLYFFAKLALAISIITVLITMNVYGFVKNQITASNLIEEEYVDPSKVNIIFPEKRQNLIYIYLESLENTFLSIENGGMYEQDRMPELAQIASDNINFSNTEKIGGAVNLHGTHWTIAAMVSQTSGVPLKISIGENDYGNHSSFLPGAYSLGEILEENGYTNYLLIGSESEFGGRKQYFESHGNYNIWDYNSAIEEKRMTSDEKVWWGYSDEDLFKYAKEQLKEISKKETPFNFTMLTVDTHFTDGYVCKNCDNTFEDQYSNVIKCSSKQVSEFIDWVKEQPFYENTTIIITGDHLTMQYSTEEEAKENNYTERTIYNAFLNTVTEANNTTNRQFFTLDMFPTTLAAIGAKIEGERLGLGTNLFSNEKTLAEKYGIQYVRDELEKKSKFYDKKLLYDD